MAEWLKRLSQGHEIYCHEPAGRGLEPHLSQSWDA